MSAQYLHMQNNDDYATDDHYPHDGGTPPGMGWDGQSDGGGKFRLKRRRRCGQCGPCQVKENCNKCQYCMRKDVLKQACVYRKCVYLRKPVPRFRHESPAPGAVTHKSTPTPPHKVTSTPAPSVSVNGSKCSSTNNSSSTVISNGTNSSSNNSTATAPVPNMSSPSSVVVPTSRTSELSSCRLNQSPFATQSVLQSSEAHDPPRHRLPEQQHGALFESVNHNSHLDLCKPTMADISRFSNGPAPPALNSNCKLDQVATTHINQATPSSLNAVNSALGSHYSHHQSTKCPPSLPSRDPYFPTMDAWSSMPYAIPHANAWATSALPSHHVAAAAAYGFQQHSAPFSSSFSPSSCRLGMPDPTASRFVSPVGPQHPFNHSVAMAGFSQDFTHATSNHHANLRTPVNPTFYPTPPHISPTSIHSFPGFGQFSAASQASFGPAAYSMHPHAHMYPGSFYSFRTATEPQIYHVEVYPSQNPFRYFMQQMPLSLQEKKGFDTKKFEFDESDCDIQERLNFKLCKLKTRQTTAYKKGCVLFEVFNPVKVLRIDYCHHDCSTGRTSPMSFTLHSSIEEGKSPDLFSSCIENSVKSTYDLIDDSVKKLISNTQKFMNTSLRKSSSSSLIKDVVPGHNENDSTNKSNTDGSSIYAEPLKQRADIDSDLESQLKWICGSVECDDEYLHEDLSSLADGRTAELGPDICIQDDNDDVDSDVVLCLQTEKSSSFSSFNSYSSLALKKVTSVTAVSQTHLSPAFLMPANLPSSLHQTQDESRVLFSEKERKHISSARSDFHQNILLRASHDQAVSFQFRMRILKRKLPSLGLKRKRLRKWRSLCVHNLLLNAKIKSSKPMNRDFSSIDLLSCQIVCQPQWSETHSDDSHDSDC